MNSHQQSWWLIDELFLDGSLRWWNSNSFQAGRGIVLRKLLFLFVVVPLVELMLLLFLADWTSAEFTFLLVIVTGVVGTLLARSQGWKTFRRIQLELSNGTLPADALLDAAMIFCAGTLLLTPGVLTDILGMTLLIPVFRRWYQGPLLRWIRRHFKVQTFHSNRRDDRSRIIDSYVVDSPPVTQSPPEDTGDSSNRD